jgi:hypothetical protein
MKGISEHQVPVQGPRFKQINIKVYEKYVSTHMIRIKQLHSLESFGLCLFILPLPAHRWVQQLDSGQHSCVVGVSVIWQFTTFCNIMTVHGIGYVIGRFHVKSDIFHFASQNVIRKAQENWEGLELNETHQLYACTL